MLSGSGSPAPAPAATYVSTMRTSRARVLNTVQATAKRVESAVCMSARELPLPRRTRAICTRVSCLAVCSNHCKALQPVVFLCL